MFAPLSSCPRRTAADRRRGRPRAADRSGGRRSRHHDRGPARLAGARTSASAGPTRAALPSRRPGFAARGLAQGCSPMTAARPGPRSRRCCRTARCPQRLLRRPTCASAASGTERQVGRRHRPAFRRPLVVSNRRSACPRGAARTPSSSSTVSSARPTSGSTVTTLPTHHDPQRRLHPLHLRHDRSPPPAAPTPSRSRLYPNDPNTMFTLDDVDWTQIPPDNNTGIQFPDPVAHLRRRSPSADAHVAPAQRSAPAPCRRSPSRADVANAAARSAVRALSPPPSPRRRGRRIRSLDHGDACAAPTRTMTFAPAGGLPARCRFRHPHVWWPYQMGAQPLYTLAAAVSASMAVVPPRAVTDLRHPHRSPRG